MEKSAITALCWIPKGRLNMRDLETMKADEGPEEEMMSEAAAAIKQAKLTAGAVKNTSAGLEEFDLDNYDEDDDESHLFPVLKADGELLRHKDPWMNKGANDTDSEDDGDDGDSLKPEDNVFIAVSCEEDSCQLELYVYDEEEGSMYVHHDLMLTAYPLCIEWLTKASPEEEGMFGVCGLIDHTIQIWDLEDPEPMEPMRCLGPEKAKKKKIGSKKKTAVSLSNAKAHDAAVLCLHANVINRNVLASGSADETVKVWDVSENKCVHVYNHHDNKVQCARWHPTEQAVLLSAAFDRKVGFLDVRQPTQAALAEIPGEAESAIWSQHNQYECLVSTDNGSVACYDIRKVVGKQDGQRLWTLSAHDVACTAVQDCPTKNLLLTAGLDGSAKVWDLSEKPRLVMSKDLKAGPLFTVAANTEAPGLFCFGGRCPVMWDLTSESVIVNAFNMPVDSAVAVEG